jgi:hypothetical protein
MMKRKPRRWPAVVTLASAGLLSGCYYYPYSYNPWGYPYPYASGYPHPYQPPAQQPAPPTPLNPPTGPPEPPNAPVERTPLPPAS